MPATIALAMRPSPIARMLRRQPQREHRERRERRQRAGEPQQLSAARVVASTAAAPRRRSTGARRARRGEAQERSCAPEQPRRDAPRRRPRRRAQDLAKPLHARRGHLGHPREPSRTRGRARRDRRAKQPDEVWCLGDLVGYGPRPNECCRRSSASGPSSRSAATTISPCSARSTWRSSAATRRRGAAGRTTSSSHDAARRGSRHSRRGDARRAPSCIHGSPRDPVWDYVLSDEVALASARADDRAARPRRAQPRPARARLDGDELDGGLAPGGDRGRARRRAAGCSTPARSASRATATRAPRGSCSISPAEHGRVPARGVRRRADAGRDRVEPAFRRSLAARLAHGI